jgi:hypothetical protein
MSKVQEVEEGEAAGTGSIPIEDADESSADGEQIVMEEIAMGESSRHVGQDGLEMDGESLNVVSLLPTSGTHDDLSLLPEHALVGSGGQGMEGDQEVEAVVQKLAADGMLWRVSAESSFNRSLRKTGSSARKQRRDTLGNHGEEGWKPATPSERRADCVSDVTQALRRHAARLAWHRR